MILQTLYGFVEYRFLFTFFAKLNEEIAKFNERITIFNEGRHGVMWRFLCISCFRQTLKLNEEVAKFNEDNTIFNEGRPPIQRR